MPDDWGNGAPDNPQEADLVDDSPDEDPWRSTVCAADVIDHKRDDLVVIHPHYDDRDIRPKKASFAAHRADDGIISTSLDPIIDSARRYLAKFRASTPPDKRGPISHREDGLINYAGRVRDAIPTVARTSFAVDDRPVEAHEKNIDVDYGVIGARNGVVDIRDMRTLSRREVHDRKLLVRSRASVDYIPDAKHEAVDRLFAHLDTQCTPNESPTAMSDYMWNRLGACTLGNNLKNFYQCIGDGDSGKTTLYLILASVFGPYFSVIPLAALAKVRANSRDQATGDLAAFVAPALYACIDEPTIKFGDPATVKGMSGGRSVVKYRLLHENNVEGTITSTTWIFANNPLNVGALDKQVAKRLTVIPFPAVPENMLDPYIKALAEGTTNKDDVDRFRQAVLAELIRRAADIIDGGGLNPAPAAVARKTKAVIGLDRGPRGELIDRLRPDPHGEFLSNDEIWEAWADICDEELTDRYGNKVRKINGLSSQGLQNVLTAALADIYPNIRFTPDDARPKFNGKRGRWNWTLLSAEDAAAERNDDDPDDELPL